MVNHSKVWQLKIAIGERITLGTMTEEHLKAFVAMSKEDLDRIFRDSSRSEPELPSNEVKGVQKLLNNWGNRY